jgi:hypothetical protein
MIAISRPITASTIVRESQIATPISAIVTGTRNHGASMKQMLIPIETAMANVSAISPSTPTFTELTPSSLAMKKIRYGAKSGSGMRSVWQRIVATNAPMTSRTTA